MSNTQQLNSEETQDQTEQICTELYTRKNNAFIKLISQQKQDYLLKGNRFSSTLPL